MRGHSAFAGTSCSARRALVRTQAATTNQPLTKALNKIQLGSSDLFVTEACLGTMTWGKQNTEADAHGQLDYAFDQGVNFIDTAEMYPVPTEAETQGRTDRYIASWLKNRRREDVILGTKVSGYSERINWVRESGAFTRVTREQILESIDKSLMRLGTDYVDLAQIHWPDRYVPLFGASAYDIKNEHDFVPFEEQLAAFDELIRQGKVRYVGVSNETSFGVNEFCRVSELSGLPKIVSIQNNYSLLVRVPFETDLAETTRFRNVGMIAYSPLASGVLSGKYLRPDVSPNARLVLFSATGYMERYNRSLAREATAEYVKIAQTYGMTPAQMAVAWCKSQWFVTSTIIGSTSKEQLVENLGSFSIELPSECIASINAVYTRYRDPSVFV